MSLMKKVFAVNREEDVLLITDDDYIADTIAQQCKELGACFNLFQISDRQRPIKRVSKVLESAIASANVILTPFKDFAKESPFRMQIVGTAIKNTASRLGHMPGVNRDVFENCILKTDYAEIERLGLRLVQALARAKSCHLTSESGTDVKLDLGGWRNRADAGIGDIRYYGSWENLPSGEAFKIPVEGTCDGTLIIDGAVPGRAFNQDEKLVLKIKNGKINRIEDHANPEFKKMLKEIDSINPDLKGNIYKIAELGIGTNKAARITSNAIEYEKILGTVHLAIGDNRFFGGKITARRHIDMLVLSPSLTVDDIVLMEGGKLFESAIEDLMEKDISEYKPYARIRVTKKTKVYPTREIGACELKDGLLYRTWKSPTGRIFRTKIGNARTAKMASQVWNIIRNEPYTVELLGEKLGVTYSDCEMLVKMMSDFQVIELSED